MFWLFVQIFEDWLVVFDFVIDDFGRVEMINE
jgi:hypothetical protein